MTIRCVGAAAHDAVPFTEGCSETKFMCLPHNGIVIIVLLAWSLGSSARHCQQRERVVAHRGSIFYVCPKRLERSDKGTV